MVITPHLNRKREPLQPHLPSISSFRPWHGSHSQDIGAGSYSLWSTSVCYDSIDFGHQLPPFGFLSHEAGVLVLNEEEALNQRPKDWREKQKIHQYEDISEVHSDVNTLRLLKKALNTRIFAPQLCDDNRGSNGAPFSSNPALGKIPFESEECQKPCELALEEARYRNRVESKLIDKIRTTSVKSMEDGNQEDLHMVGETRTDDPSTSTTGTNISPMPKFMGHIRDGKLDSKSNLFVNDTKAISLNSENWYFKNNQVECPEKGATFTFPVTNVKADPTMSQQSHYHEYTRDVGKDASDSLTVHSDSLMTDDSLVEQFEEDGSLVKQFEDGSLVKQFEDDSLVEQFEDDRSLVEQFEELKGHQFDKNNLSPRIIHRDGKEKKKVHIQLDNLEFIRKDWHMAAKAGCCGCGEEGCYEQCLRPEESCPEGEKAVSMLTPDLEFISHNNLSDDGNGRSNPMQWTRGEVLGEGAYGKVFAGLNQTTGELMAVKQLKVDKNKEGGKDYNARERQFHLAALQREVSLYKTLKHKHIVRYIDMNEDEESGSLYIFLEFVSGGSIQSMLERFGQFSENVIQLYTRQLLLGLEYLHARKLVHRDIKGGNVLVNDKGVVKLADFGASKVAQDAGPTETMGLKSVRGSVFWMAPEIIKGDGYGRRADIWSLGCTVVEMLTANHPWPEMDNTWSAIFHIVKAGSGPPVPQGVSQSVKDFLRMCFNLDPRLRPTASELLGHPFIGQKH